MHQSRFLRVNLEDLLKSDHSNVSSGTENSGWGAQQSRGGPRGAEVRNGPDLQRHRAHHESRKGARARVLAVD